jgi:hypothetical protein
VGVAEIRGVQAMPAHVAVDAADGLLEPVKVD